ncbi:MAG: response regulator [Clostridiales Family XIII bacterium]|jgi:signal transduction histidine kinase/ActR/RegA family two-component response regulator|nr:response regulator [Clostridiales Family XIII bacterium]
MVDAIEEILRGSSGMTAEQIETLADEAGVGLFTIDITTGKIAMNRIIANLTQYQLGELPESMETRDILTFEDDRERVHNAMESIFTADAQFYHVEYRMRRRDSSLVSVYECGMISERDEAGRPTSISVLALDLTRLKWAQDKARQMETENRRLAKSQTENSLAEQNRMLRAANSAAAMIIGGFHEEYEMVLRQALQMLAESVQADRAYIWRNRLVDGRLFSFRRVLWERGGSFGFTSETSIAYGGSELVPYDELLPDWEALIEPGFSIITNENNKEVLDKYGINMVAGVKGCMVQPIYLHGEFWGFVGFDDCTHADRVFTEDEADIMLSATFVIASSVARNETLKVVNDAREAAMASTKAKGDFLARMSHEIRTPMNAIIGMTTIAKRTRDPEKVRYCLDKVDVSSRQLLNIINDVLDMSKIDANKLEIVPAPFDFEQMIQDVISVVKVKLEEKNQHFQLAMTDIFTRKLISDELRLTQVLINLLNNAMKFTPEGGTITLKVDEIVSGNILHIEVADTGIGIDPENQDKLFHSFEQADGGITRQFGGTGLGLAICKRIVDLMGGNIWIDSVLGEGSNFIFEIPVSWDDKVLAPMNEHGVRMVEELPDAPDWREKTILLADDIDINREIVETILSESEVGIVFAENGEEAVEAFKKSPELFDLILMDIQMPKLDGLGAAKAIRALADEIPKAGDIPIIAMTANAFKEDVEQSLSSGMNGHIAKPVEIDELFAILTRYFEV